VRASAISSGQILITIMKSILKTCAGILIALILIFTTTSEAWAFCGFYVGGADAKLFNEASQVIIAHKDNKTILTMANDFQGAIKDFALVVPVPVAIKREQVNIGSTEIIKKLDTFSQPRLVEYNDPNPCEPPQPLFESAGRPLPASIARPAPPSTRPRSSLGVTIEDQFKVKEYEILILSAKESDGLETWLRTNGYQIPQGASEVLKPYIRQKMKFFVAKIDLKEFKKTGLTALRPLQIAYQSPKFMLPIRLGMLNAKGDQDLVAYILSPKGQVEVANYRTVKVPTGQEIPEFVKEDFGKFYKTTFQRSYEKANKKVAFLEYAWDVSNCDPCSTTPPDDDELKKAGVFWQESADRTFITRLHVRYSRSKFAEDLVFQETSNQNNFQGRYVMTHPFRGTMTCSAANQYRQQVSKRQEKEVQNLSQLTGWSAADLRKRVQPLAGNPIKKVDYKPFWPWAKP
jgi:hypothetical protein